jgi:hypothetical protein
MHTIEQAISKAKKIGKKIGREVFVVYSPGEYDIPGNDYHVANDIDVDTFYNGCEVLFSTEEV